MAARPGIIVDVQHDADGGDHPNKYNPVVSVHVRAYWPPLATQRQVEDALKEAYVASLAAFRSKCGLDT